MRLSDIKVGMKVEVVSLDHTYVGCAPFKIGDVYTVHGIGASRNTATILDDHGKKWGINHEDVEPVVEYTHPMQEHLGKEVITTFGRGFAVSTSTHLDDLYLLVDFGDGFIGHKGGCSANHIQDTETCNWAHCNECTFLTEDDE